MYEWQYILMYVCIQQCMSAYDNIMTYVYI